MWITEIKVALSHWFSGQSCTEIWPFLCVRFYLRKYKLTYQKLLEIEKEIVHEVARGDKPYLKKSTDRKAQIRTAFVQLSGLICAFRSADFRRWCLFIPRAQPHAQSLFLFPIVFGINLIHFFDISTRKNGAAGNSIVCFAASIACQSRHLTVRRMRTVSKSATFWQRKVWTQRHSKGEKLRCKFFGKG